MALSLTITKQRNLNWLLAILFLPLVLSYVLPLLFYRIPIRLAATNAVVEFAGGEILYATMVWVIWIGIAVITPLLLSRIKPSIGNERPWSLTTLWRGFVVLSVISGLISPLRYFFSFHSGIEQLLQQLSFAPVVAVVLGIRVMQDINLFNERRRLRKLLGGVLLLSLNSANALVLPVLMGRAAPAIYAGLAILYGVHSLKIERKKLIAIWLVFFTLAGLALAYKSNFRTSGFGSIFGHHGQYIRIPIMDVLHGRIREAYRQQTDGRSFDVGKLLSLAEDYSSYDINYYDRIRFFSSDDGIPEKAKYLIAKTLSRVNHLGELAYVIRTTPDPVPYLHGSTYYPLLFKPIPRLFWEDKPEDNSGQIFGHRYGLLNPTDTATSANMGVVIEAWINGGWTVLVLSSFAFGMLIYLAWRYLLGESGEIGNIVLGTVFIVSGVTTESSMNLVAGGILYGVLVWWVMEHIIRTKL